MKILIALTYYRPHTSGLTIYVERLAKALAARGHTVRILTSQYSSALSRRETVDGVEIIRVPVAFRISKGVIMPGFGIEATRQARWADVIHLHLPQFDAAGLALRGRIMNKPTVITYHCDLQMPPGFLAWVANQAILLMNNLAGLFTHRVVAYTRDYAESSPYLRRLLKKIKVISPPVELPSISEADKKAFKERWNPGKQSPVIGMAARFASEKGVEVLINAMPKILKLYPKALVLFAGPYQNIIGEESYFARLKPQIDRLAEAGNWRFLGNLTPEQMAAYYPMLDVLVLPSLNSTESFGLVQIEAMLNGIPCVASNLPGVRQPVLRHGLGKIIPIGSASALAQAVVEILQSDFPVISKDALQAEYAPDSVARQYETLFLELLHPQPQSDKS